MKRPNSGSSIARKLQALVLAAVVAATATVGGLSLWVELARYADAKRETLLATAQVFASVASGPVAQADRAAAHRVLRAISRMPDITYARVETLDGGKLAEIGGGARLSTDIRLDSATDGIDIGRLLATSSVEASAPVVQGGRRVGRFVLVARATDLRERVQGILLRSVLACVVALLIGLAIAARLQKSITDPIRQLDNAVARIRESQSFDVSMEAASDDEVGRLVDGFNAMLGEIRDRDARLDKHLKGLEREVDARTRDLRVARDVAENANRAKSDFLAAMSHEIRTPMNGVMVMAELLAAGNLAEKPRRYADVIVRSGKNLLAIINDLLDFSKIEAGKLDLESTRVDLVEIADQTASLFWERARSKGLDLATYVAPDAPRFVTGDPVRIGQIVTNLVSNALKFTESGSVLVTIMRDAKRRDVMRIAVRDTGVGIPADKISGVFQAFTQADQSTTRKFGGTGLGLTICRRLTTAMGGDIRVASELGKGSTFAADLTLPALEAPAAWPRWPDRRVALIDCALPATRRVLAQYLLAAGYEIRPERDGEDAVRLVIADADRLSAHAHTANAVHIVLREMGDAAADHALAQGGAEAALDLPLMRIDVEALLSDLVESRACRSGARPVHASVQSRYAGRVALVVDDNAVNREVAMESLSRFGVAADTAENGRLAVDMAALRAYDIIFMDGSMPEMDGLEATRIIRAQERTRNTTRIPIIALTADVLGASSDAWRDAGADGVLHKPFTMAALGAHLTTFFGAPMEQGEAVDVMTDDAAASQTGPSFAHLDTLGAPEFVQRVVGLYRSEAPKRMADLVAAVEAGDQEAAARSAHAIKSMSLSLGARDVAETSGNLERRVRIESAEISSDDVVTLQAKLKEAIAAMNVAMSMPDAKPEQRVARTGLAAELERAIQAEDLQLHYQPIVDRSGDALMGFEALVRWPRLTGARIGAQELVRCAEDHGLIGMLGDWAIERAARDSAGWRGIFVSVNASPTQLRDPDFDTRVFAALERNGIDPRNFVIEITEQATLEADATVIDLINRLRARGVKIALDDFGTGYSSLTHLRRLPIDKVKIDRSFVTDLGAGLEGATIIHAVVAIGRTLGFQMVAEGVETSEQHAFLRAAGVHALQGYLFGKAMPIAEANALVARHAARARSA